MYAFLLRVTVTGESVKIEALKPSGEQVLDSVTTSLNGITPREREIWGRLATGLSVKDIASELSLSVKTVEAHKFNLMRKLDVHNKAQLIIRAVQDGVIKIPPK